MAELLPHIVKIDFGSKKHTDVLSYIMNRVQSSRTRRGKRQEKWAEAEDLFTSYVKETDADAKKRVKKDQGMPEYTTITIPYSYATLMTAHTYWTSVFLAREPILQVQGTNGEAQTSEQAVEAMLQYFMTSGKNLVPFFVWLLDAGKYGEGIIGTCWDTERTFIPELQIGPRMLPGAIPIPFTEKKTWVPKEVIGYEGVRYFNVRPQDFLFDTTVTLQSYQKGEFAGHESFVSYVRILDGKARGLYYNTDFVQGRVSSRRTTNASGNDQDLPQDDVPNVDIGDRPYGVDMIEITLEIIPRDLGLANREHLEKWSFTIANDQTIISAQPQGFWHNEFMYDALEYEIEGYNVSKRGMMEMLRPLNQTLDWLINTHFFNVRKALNNEFIYDPSRLVQKDVERPGPGKLIRFRPEAYGQNIQGAFAQLNVGDVTRSHIQDANVIVEMMQRITGVNDTVMGLLSTNRKTATEVRSTTSMAVNRLKTQCEFFSAMGFGPLTSRSIKTSQQMLQGRKGRYYRIVGNRSETTERFLEVGPSEIAGQFDYLPVDGTMPIDRQAQAAVFGQTMEQMARVPQVAQQYDFGRLFGYLAELQGIRNIQRFKIQVVPDAQAQAGAAAGNLVPVPNMVNNGAGIPPGGAQ